MEAKEKAKEIFNKMKGFRVKHSHSKKCALVCVDEILDHFNINWTWMSNDIADKQLWKDEFVFWQEVKKELEKINQLKQ